MEEKITLKTVLTPSENIVAREIEGDIIIVPLVSGIGDADDELYTLNPTGQAIWRKLDGQKTLGQVITELKDEYSSGNGDLEADVMGFATEMSQRGILAVK